MRLNKIMEELIQKVKNEEKDNTTGKFLDLFCPTFIEWDECVLLNYGNNLNDMAEKFAPNNVISDRTQFEATNNHIHLIDTFPELEENTNQILRIALGLAEVWTNKLKVSFPSEKFHLVISHDEFGSTIRFYKIRTNEIPWIDVNSIDNFKNEAILLIEI